MSEFNPKGYKYPTTRNQLEDIEVKTTSKPWLTKRDMGAFDHTQAELMLLEQIQTGKTIEKIARERGIHPRTAARRIQRAKNAGVLRDTRQVLIDELLDPAISVLKASLKSENPKIALQAAIKVIEGLDAFTDHEKKDEETTTKQAIAESLYESDSFEIFRARVTRKRPESASSQSNAPEADPDTVEGILLRSELEAPPSEADAAPAEETPGEPDSETGL